VIVQVPPRSPVQKTPIQKPDQPPDSTLPVPPTDLGNPPAEPPFAACPEKPTIQQLVEDTKKIQEEIRKLCERPLPEGLPGPPGPAGTSPPVSEIAQAVLQGIKSDPQLIALLKGPQGDPGPPGPQGPPGTSPEPPKPGPVPDWSHLVLVTPAKAEYAVRLADEIKRPRTTTTAFGS